MLVKLREKCTGGGDGASGGSHVSHMSHVSSASSSWGRFAATAMVVVCLAMGSFGLGGCSDEYDRSTPEGTIATARKMLQNGDGRRVGELIYAQNQDEARLMRRMGIMLGNLDTLGNSIKEKFPKEVADLQARAEAASKDGKGASMVNRLFSQVRPQQGMRRRNAGEGGGARGGRPSGRPGQETEQLFNDLLKTLFADPYGWLKDSETQLTTVYLTEDSVALLWEEKPILPPIGLTMRKTEKGLWAFALPTNFPGVSSFWPKSKDEFEIWGGLVQVFDNVIVDLTKDVRDGRATSLDDVARRAGEKTFVPAVITFFAFTQLQDAQKKEAKEAKAAQKELAQKEAEKKQADMKETEKAQPEKVDAATSTPN